MRLRHHVATCEPRQAPRLNPYILNEVERLAGVVDRRHGATRGHLDIAWMPADAFVAARRQDPYQAYVGRALTPKEPAVGRLLRRRREPPIGCPAAFLPSQGHIVTTYRQPSQPADYRALLFALVESCLLRQLDLAEPARARRAFLNRLRPRSPKADGRPDWDRLHQETLRATRALWAEVSHGSLTDAFLRTQWLISEADVQALAVRPDARRLPSFRSIRSARTDATGSEAAPS